MTSKGAFRPAVFRLSTPINTEISEIRKIDQGTCQQVFKNTLLHDKVCDFDNCHYNN